MKTLTTGDIAHYMDVNQRTVIRWLDSGRLKGFKLPGRGNNRVLVSDFISFLEQNQIPVPESLQQYQTVEQHVAPAKVLLVDDEEAVLQAVKRALKPLNVNLVTACNGFQAGFELERFNPDLIVLDLSMPGIDGFTVIRYIREELGNSEIRIVVVSALGPEQLQRTIDLGADAAIAKPFDNVELRQTVTGLLELETTEQACGI